MSDINYKRIIVKCPNKSCNSNIQITIGKGPAINDNGGWILECNQCKTTFPYSVKNPDDYSKVEKGATILDSWDDEVVNSKQDAIEKFKLQSFPTDFAFDRILIVQTGEYERQKFSDIEENIFFCPRCKGHIEPLVYSQLETALPAINSSIGAYMNYYLKGKGGNPDSIIVISDYKCSCQFTTNIILYKKFEERELPLESAHELILIDVVGADLEFTIDGIYDRDSCLEVLQKLLIRWQVYYNKVFLAVPFIGFDFKNSEAQRVELWNWILRNTLPHKTVLITRKATFNSFVEGSSNTGLDIKVLKEYGILNPTINELTEKNALFKTNFHAKFYAGFDRQTSEVLVGSFNIHEGGYVENIHFKKYDFGDFFSKYILKMGVIFNPREIDENGEILFVRQQEGDLKFKSFIEKYDHSRREKIYEVINSGR